jgi:integrase
LIPALSIRHSCGLRPGELAGLQWGDIDFLAKFIIVRRNVVFGRVGLKSKTGKKRNMDASDELLTVLHELNRMEPTARVELAT